MVQRLACVTNENIAACYNFTQDAVIINDSTGRKNKVFSGFDGLNEMFETFADCVTDTTTFEDAVHFFKPTIGNVFIK